MSNIAKNDIVIRKASGKSELFQVAKLEDSLRKAGADEKTINEIAADIQNWLYDGVTTRKIYARAFSLLRRTNDYSALRYKVKQALFDLGPSGYPFEQFVGEVFKKQGYRVEIGQETKGRCISHEIDVIATKEQKQHFIECKYGNDQSKTVSIQVPLYVRSRVNDIIEKRREMDEYQGFDFIGWVATNTRFSPDSIAYGKCSGLKLLGWNFPQENGLQQIIEQTKVFPLTVLHTLTKSEKEVLLEQGIVTCGQLLENMSFLSRFNWKTDNLRKLQEELNMVCRL